MPISTRKLLIAGIALLATSYAGCGFWYYRTKSDLPFDRARWDRNVMPVDTDVTDRTRMADAALKKLHPGQSKAEIKALLGDCDLGSG